MTPYQRRLRRSAAKNRNPPARVLLFHCDGTMVVEAAITHGANEVTVRRETIPATVASLDAWLGQMHWLMHLHT